MSEEKSKTEKSKPDATPYKVWLAGLGVLSQAREEDSDQFDEMVERGRGVVSNRTDKVKDEVSKFGAWFETTMGKLGNGIDSKLQSLSESLGLAARGEVENLSARIAELEEKLRQAIAESATDEPATDEPDEPGTDEPDTDEPGTDQPGTDEPDEPVAAESAASVKVLLVTSHDDGWQVQVEGTQEPVSVHRTKADAVAAAKAAAQKAEPSRLLVYLRDGSVQTESEYRPTASN